jgi:predicted aminopeptidase
VPAFRALLAREKRFDKFYDAVRALSVLNKQDRYRRLAALAQPPVMADGKMQASFVP